MSDAEKTPLEHLIAAEKFLDSFMPDMAEAHLLMAEFKIRHGNLEPASRVLPDQLTIPTHSHSWVGDGQSPVECSFPGCGEVFIA